MTSGDLTHNEPTVGPSRPILGTYKRAPMEFLRGEGVQLFDVNGKAYLDMASGIAVVGTVVPVAKRDGPARARGERLKSKV